MMATSELKVVSVVGTRPNFIKECSLNPAFRRRGVREILVHTGQHYDYQMSGLFFRELEIPKPDYLAEMPQSKGGARVARMIEFIEGILLEERPGVCIVTGDVDSAMAVRRIASRTEFWNATGNSLLNPGLLLTA